MTNTKKTLQELNDIIDFLKDKVDRTTRFAGTEKADWEKRINKVRNNDKSQELSLKGIEALDNLSLTEKAELLAEKKTIEESKKKAEDDLVKKQAELDKLKSKIITIDLFGSNVILGLGGMSVLILSYLVFFKSNSNKKIWVGTKGDE